MAVRPQLEARVQKWVAAGVIDVQAASRILEFEAGQERRTTLRWPVLLALIFGGILLAAGVTLFVAAHWSELSPASRFSLVLLMVVVFQAGGAVLADRLPAFSTTLYAVGTATLGAAIFLTAQIFNLHENWATGVLLWAIGAAAGYLILREWPQAGLLALLTPGWLVSQWSIAIQGHRGGARPLAVGLILTALCYLSARMGAQESAARRTLVWIGGIALVPCVGTAIAVVISERYDLRYDERPLLSSGVSAVHWTVAVMGPLLLSWILRGRRAWMNVLSAAWAYALVLAAAHSSSFVGKEYRQSLGMTLAIYGLCALGAVGLVAWGLHEKRKERLNLGVAGFALSVVFFYFDSFMGKLGRSFSLLVLGLLCIVVGYVLEVTRRKLVARMERGL